MVSQLFLGTLQKELSNILFCNAVLRNQAFFFPVMAYKQVVITSYLKRLEEVGLRRGGRAESSFIFLIPTHHILVQFCLPSMKAVSCYK